MLSQCCAIFCRQIVVMDIERGPADEFVADQKRRAHAVNFEINCKLLIGLRLANSDVRLGFFIIKELWGVVCEEAWQLVEIWCHEFVNKLME